MLSFKKMKSFLTFSFTKKLISATADGASVNTGQYTGVLKQLTDDNRAWLITIHCALHRVELALKDSLLKNKLFTDVKDFLTTLYHMFRRSGKLKRMFKDSAQALQVQVYIFNKVHGTRFINHTRRALDHLLKNWVVFGQTLENIIANYNHGTIRTLNAKFRNVINRLQDFSFLATCAYFKTILDKVSVLSLRLQRSDIFVFEVWPQIQMTISSLQDMANDPETFVSQPA